jgi:hypothetical protein
MILLIIILSCAARTRIFDIKQTPRKFHDKSVSISGTVINTITLPVLNIGVFQVDDGSGKIWVKPKTKTPLKGERVAITGKIKVGFTISGRSFGVILLESGTDEPL